MNVIPFGNQLGLVPRATSVSGSNAREAQARSPLIDILPTFREPISASFKEVAVPLGTDCSAAAAWFPLIDIDVADAFGQEVMLFSIDVDQLSPDVAGDAGNVYLPWGDDSPSVTSQGTGNGAYIVCGTNLPITGVEYGVWKTATCNLAGMNSSGVPLLVQSDRAQYILARPFPTGQYGATSQVRRTITKSWAPYGYRFPLGSRIQAALVIQGSKIVAPTDQIIRGGASIQMWCGMTRNAANFGSLT